MQSDEKTVYLTSDGDTKGMYKFVADEPIPSTTTRWTCRARCTRRRVDPQADASTVGTRKSPAEYSLDIEWIPLGSASNAEIEEWIADTTTSRNLTTSESTLGSDWMEDREAALEEAAEKSSRRQRELHTNEERPSGPTVLRRRS